MQTPVLCERVHVLSREESYFVTSIDEDAKEVNLIPVSGHGASLEGVPFSELRKGPVWKSPAD